MEEGLLLGLPVLNGLPRRIWRLFRPGLGKQYEPSIRRPYRTRTATGLKPALRAGLLWVVLFGTKKVRVRIAA